MPIRSRATSSVPKRLRISCRPFCPPDEPLDRHRSLASGRLKVVADHQHVCEIQFVKVTRFEHAEPAAIHQGVWTQQQHPLLAQARLDGFAMETGPGSRLAKSLHQPLRDGKPHVVPGSRVLASRVTQTNDQFHACGSLRAPWSPLLCATQPPPLVSSALRPITSGSARSRRGFFFGGSSVGICSLATHHQRVERRQHHDMWRQRDVGQIIDSPRCKFLMLATSLSGISPAGHSISTSNK